MKKNSLALLFLILSNFALAQNNNRILIAAASDLKFALDSLVTVFKRAHANVIVDVTYGSSGKLYEQISHSFL